MDSNIFDLFFDYPGYTGPSGSSPLPDPLPYEPKMSLLEENLVGKVDSEEQSLQPPENINAYLGPGNLRNGAINPAIASNLGLQSLIVPMRSSHVQDLKPVYFPNGPAPQILPIHGRPKNQVTDGHTENPSVNPVSWISNAHVYLNGSNPQPSQHSTSSRTGRSVSSPIDLTVTSQETPQGSVDASTVMSAKVDWAAPSFIIPRSSRNGAKDRKHPVSHLGGVPMQRGNGSSKLSVGSSTHSSHQGNGVEPGYQGLHANRQSKVQSGRIGKDKKAKSRREKEYSPNLPPPNFEEKELNGFSGFQGKEPHPDEEAHRRRVNRILVELRASEHSINAPVFQNTEVVLYPPAPVPFPHALAPFAGHPHQQNFYSMPQQPHLMQSQYQNAFPGEAGTTTSIPGLANPYSMDPSGGMQLPLGMYNHQPASYPMVPSSMVPPASFNPEQAFPGHSSNLGQSFPGHSSSLGSSFPGNSSSLGQSFPGNASTLTHSYPAHSSSLEQSFPGYSSTTGQSFPGHSSTLGQSYPGQPFPGHSSTVGHSYPAHTSTPTQSYQAHTSTLPPSHPTHPFPPHSSTLGHSYPIHHASTPTHSYPPPPSTAFPSSSSSAAAAAAAATTTQLGNSRECTWKTSSVAGPSSSSSSSASASASASSSMAAAAAAAAVEMAARHGTGTGAGPGAGQGNVMLQQQNWNGWME